MYLVRHAESLENSMIADFKMLAGIWPTPEGQPRPSIWNLTGLLNVPALVDCPLSDTGVKQATNLEVFCKNYNGGAGFIPTVCPAGEPCLVVHSPLRRARQTCHSATGLAVANYQEKEYDYTSGGFPSSDANVSVIEQPLLLEKTPVEWLPGMGGRLAERIENFKAWVEGRQEERIVVVGHSQWFRKMLGMEKKVRTNAAGSSSLQNIR